MSTLAPAAAPPPAWSAEQERTLFAMQVAELYRFGPFAAASSFIGAAITYAVLIDTGDGAAGLYWFSLFTCLTIYRVAVIVGYDRADGAHPATWSKLAIIGNVAAGTLWGVLGSLLFPETLGYRELFTVMVLACYVGGSVTSYAAVKWAHAALAVPAVLPPIIYLTFMRDGLHLYSALMASVFLVAVIGIANKLHAHIAERFRLLIENRQLVTQLQAAMAQLSRENRDLEHRAAVRLKTAREAQGRANMLAAHFDHLPIPMAECDPLLHVLEWNDAMQRLLGHDLEVVRGQPFLPLLNEETAALQGGELLLAAQERRACAVRVTLRDKSGQQMRATLSAIPHFPTDGAPGRIALVMTDLQR